MAGHSPAPVVEAVRRRIDTLGGITAMLPSEDAEWVAAELTRRFGLTQWSFALSATDANRWALRLARLATGRPKILVFSYCYHGSVDETFVVAGAGRHHPLAAGQRGAGRRPVDDDGGRRVQRPRGGGPCPAHRRDRRRPDRAGPHQHRHRRSPTTGFHDGLRALCDETGTLLMIDETHTLSAGPGGCTAAWGLHPDIVTMGKAIAGGIPIGAFGLRAELADRILGLVRDQHADIEDVGRHRRDPGRQRPVDGGGPGHAWARC